jgi:hypothetical protein
MCALREILNGFFKPLYTQRDETRQTVCLSNNVYQLHNIPGLIWTLLLATHFIWFCGTSKRKAMPQTSTKCRQDSSECSWAKQFSAVFVTGQQHARSLNLIPRSSQFDQIDSVWWARMSDITDCNVAGIAMMQRFRSADERHNKGPPTSFYTRQNKRLRTRQ